VSALIAFASLAAIGAPFLLYPLVLFVRARIAADPVAEADHTPDVDLIICAHNEAASIRAKLENALGLDYPEGRLTIWVASDGSTDETVRIAREFESRGVHVLDLPRNGKAYALDMASKASHAEILAFSDANSQWLPEALRALMRPLADPRVGGVAGDQRYGKIASQDLHDASIGERSYWSFDRKLKHWQSRSGNTISATGAIYAVRRSLFQPPPADATDDFMISTGVIAAGKRLVFSENAVAVEPPAEGSTGEFRRKVRIITRGLRAVSYRRALLNPTRTGAYAFELLIHKLWRRLTWIPLLVLLFATPLFWTAGGALATLGSFVVAGFSAGVVGLAYPSLQRFKLIAMPAYGVMVNAACAMATINALRGHRVSHWDPERVVDPAPGPLS
jgi:cellulose synthase/poly-beta-1,6-N-acetylglucosamine synthase-like glycosyltransferase